MKRKLLLIFVITFLIICSVIFAYIYLEDFRATKEGIVMKVDKNSLSIIESGTNSLYTISFSKEGNIGFKIGQKVLIYFDGMIAESYPAQIHKVGKIKIIEDETDISTIPENILRYYNSSRDNVKVYVSEFNSNGLTLTISDKNEYKYNYSNSYSIYKKVKNENYTGIGYKIGNDTQNSTSGYTGTGLQYMWEKVNKVLDIESKDTITSKIIDNTTLKNTYNLRDIYGELESGEYYFTLSIGDLGFSFIKIDFKISESGKLTYYEPVLEY